MKKIKIALLAFCSICLANTNAQSIEIHDFFNSDKTFANGDTLEFFIGSLEQKYENIFVSVKNISMNTIHVNLKQTVLNRLENAIYSFCWGTCYDDPMTSTLVGDPEMAVEINSGSLASELCICDFCANGTAGVTYVRYTFFDQNNPDDSCCFIVKYNDAKVGISETEAPAIHLSAFPNPATDCIRIRVEQMQMPEQAMLRVCDIKGAVLFEGAFTGQEMDIPTGNWSNGTYFCSLIDPRGTLEVKQFNIQR